MLPQGCFSKLRLSVHFVLNHGRYPWLEICRPFRALLLLLLLQKDTTRPLISPCGVHGTTCPVAHCPALYFVKQNSSAGYSQLVLITVALAKVIANSAMVSGMLYHRAHAVFVIKRNIDAITHKLYPKPYSARRSETEVGTLDPNS